MRFNVTIRHPFALSLSKGCSFFDWSEGEKGCFDKLSTNGGEVV